MKMLLDENLPKRLKNDFPGHEVYTVTDQGWNGMKDGPLLELIRQNNFQAFLTFDKNLQYQKNLKKYPFSVLVLSASNNTYKELTKLSPRILEFLRKGTRPTGPIRICF